MTFRYPVRVMKDGQTDPPGWVPSSHSLAGAPANAVRSTVFDLGAEWSQYGCLVLAVVGTQPLASISASASDDGVNASAPLAGGAADGSLVMALTDAGTVQGQSLVGGRYVVVGTTNGPSPQGAGACIRLTVYPN